jgi:hypothetical protein
MNWLWDMDASHDIGGDASMDDGVLLPISYFVFVGSFYCFFGGVVLVIGGCSVSCSLHVISSSHLGINTNFLHAKFGAPNLLFF